MRTRDAGRERQAALRERIVAVLRREWLDCEAICERFGCGDNVAKKCRALVRAEQAPANADHRAAAAQLNGGSGVRR